MAAQSIRRALLMTAGAIWLASGVQAAKPVPTPSQQLKTDENIVALVQVAAKSADNQLLLKAEQMLHGDTFTEQKVRAEAATYASVQVGQRYVVAFSWFTKDPLTRGKGWVKNTEGPEIVGFTEVANALFPAEPALLHLLSLSNEPSSDAARVDDCLQLLALADYRLRYFCSLELLLQPRLASAFDEARRDRLQQLLAGSDYAPEHRDLLYRAALTLPSTLRGDWLADLARRDLQKLGNQYDLATRVPGLAKAATQILREHGSASDATLLSALLRSNAPGVGKMALEALAQHAGTAAQQSVAAALADPSLPAESRRVFERYRKQGVLPG